MFVRAEYPTEPPAASGQAQAVGRIETFRHWGLGGAYLSDMPAPYGVQFALQCSILCLIFSNFASDHPISFF